MSTPAAILAAIPLDLIRRHPDPTRQITNAKSLAKWLSDRGHRPTLAELEQERARRTPDPVRQPQRKKSQP